MSDRELLELAAKAVGLDARFSPRGDVYIKHSNKSTQLWNPLTDDGDSLRLAIELKIRMNPEADGRALVEFWSKCRWRELGNSSKECPHENMRRAIVRAAAEIGKSLP